MSDSTETDKKYSAVCFDVDGTFYPKSVMRAKLIPLYMRHPVFAVRYRKMRRLFRKMQSSFASDIPSSFRDREASLMKGHYTAEILDRKFYKPMKRKYRRLKSFDGVKETLQRLKQEGIKIGVLSDFPLFDKLNAMGIAQYIDVAISSDDTCFLKPDIHGFDLLLYKLNVEPCRALYVGDSQATDAVGASAYGMDYFILSSWKDIDEHLKECGL